MRIAVVQHRIRTHERMDLAALLALTEDAAEAGAGVIAHPRVPGLERSSGLIGAFAANAAERAPGVVVIAPPSGVPARQGVATWPIETPLGKAVVLASEDCIDPGLFEGIRAAGVEALVWQTDASSDAEAEATLELALDASLTLAGLVLVAGVVGSARDACGYGGSAIVHLGEILAEAGSGEELLLAEVSVPVRTNGRGGLPEPAPILVRALSERRSVRAGHGR